MSLCLKYFVRFHTIRNLCEIKERLCVEYGGGNDAIDNSKTDNSQFYFSLMIVMVY